MASAIVMFGRDARERLLRNNGVAVARLGATGLNPVDL